MDLKTLVKIRGTARASVTRIISKCRNILEQNLAEKEAELMIVFQNLRKKNRDINTNFFYTNKQRSYYATWWRRIRKWRDSMWTDRVKHYTNHTKNIKRTAIDEN